MITILQIPTNVFPDDECVVIDKHKPQGSDDYDNAPRFTYTFHGDELRWGLIEYYNNTTEEKYDRHAYFPRGGLMKNTYHNGDTVRINELVFNDIAENGKNYKYRYTLFQTDPTRDDAGEYNIYFCRGKIRAIPSGATQSSTEVYINTEIENLKNAYRYTYTNSGVAPDGTVIPAGTVRLVGGAYMEIGEERRLIESYSFSTGKVTLQSAFTTYPTEGTTYKIFTNYLLTPYYFVKCRELPTTSITVTEANHGIHCQLTYSQANHVGLKCYKVALYKRGADESSYIDGNIIAKDPDNTAECTIETGLSTDIVGRIIRIENVVGSTPEGYHVSSNYTQSEIISYNPNDGTVILKINYKGYSNINVGAKYTIVDDQDTFIEESDWLYTYDLDYTFYTDYKGKKYRIEYSVVSQDDVMVTSEQNVSYSNSSNIATFNNLSGRAVNSSQYVIFTWTSIDISSGTKSNLMVFRKDNHNDRSPVLLRSDHISKYWVDRNYMFIDWTAANNHTYEYIFVLRDSDNNAYRAVTSESITTNWEGWSLLALGDKTSLSTSQQSDDCNKILYTPNGIWTFAAGISGEDITTHIGVLAHTMTGIKPKTTRNDELYESGSFGAYVDSLNCASENPQNYIVDNIERVKAWIKFVSRKCDFILKSDKGDAWVINISDNPTRSYDSSTIELLTTIHYSWIECEDIENIMLKG